MKYNIREMKNQERSILEDFLYEAIYIPEGFETPDRSIIYQPELQVYISDFGCKEDDICFVAEVEKGIIGAVWVRDMNDYGHIEDGIPSFAISLYKEYRGYGIGTELMKKMLTELKLRGYKEASLSVQKANYAVSMYQKLGFEIIDENDEEYKMIYRF
ncbi:MAG: GNAT family N-acetyltransferase [Lachnospira sp.]